jgi:condensin-2 complex subunit D3
MGNLMQFLRELMKDYKDEIQEILAEDRQLMAEIDFDIKRYEQQERMDAELSTPRVDRTIPPPDLVNPREDEQVRIPPNDRRSLANVRTSNPADRPVENAKKSNSVSETANVTVAEVLSAPTETQETTNKTRKSVGKTQVSFTNEGSRLNEDPVEKEQSVADTSIPFLQPNNPNMQNLPPMNVAAKRLLRSRIMSTPIRNVPVDDVSFQIRDVDLSEIHLPEVENQNQTDSLPELESTPKKKHKRRRCD